jgi:hypothetical protein
MRSWLLGYLLTNSLHVHAFEVNFVSGGIRKKQAGCGAEERSTKRRDQQPL